MISDHKGLSLIELLVTLAVLAILLTLSLPGLGDRRGKIEGEKVMAELTAAISMARASAVDHNLMVTLCRSDDGLHCQGSWKDGSIIFTDENEDRIVNGNDRLLYRTSAMQIGGTLRFRSFRNRQYLQMTPRGFTNYQNGNFTYCPADGDPRLARQIIVSLSGRTRMARDLDGDGIVEDSRGNPLKCR